MSEQVEGNAEAAAVLEPLVMVNLQVATVKAGKVEAVNKLEVGVTGLMENS